MQLFVLLGHRLHLVLMLCILGLQSPLQAQLAEHAQSVAERELHDVKIAQETLEIELIQGEDHNDFSDGE